MNIYLLLAAGLSSLGGVLHSILGERLFLSKLAPEKLPETFGSSVFTLQIVRLFWHLVSVAWWGFAAVLILIATMPTSDDGMRIISIIGFTFLVSAVVSFSVSRGKHFSWGVLLVIAILAWLGAK